MRPLFPHSERTLTVRIHIFGGTMELLIRNGIVFTILWILSILIMSILEYAVNRLTRNWKNVCTAIQFLIAYGMILLTMFWYTWGQETYRWLVALIFGLVLWAVVKVVSSLVMVYFKIQLDHGDIMKSPDG
jgi:hypothetical protein